LPDDICTAAMSIASISDIDTKLKLLQTHNLDKWVFMHDSSTSRYCSARISYGNSVCLSIRPSRPGTESST